MTRRCCVVVFAAAGLALFATASRAQIGFKQDERAMVQKYKASNVRLEEAKALFAKGKFDKAEAKIKDCLAMFPKNSDAQYLRAQIELKRGALEPALASIQGAESSFVEISQLYTFTHQEMMADLRDQRSKLQESIRAGEDSVAQVQNWPPSEARTLALSEAQGRLQADQNLMTQIDQQLVKPVPQTMAMPAGYHFIHGNILLKLKRPADAAAEYQETVRLDPDHGNAYNNLASIYFVAGQYQKALDFLNQAEAKGVKVNPAFKKDVEERLAKK